MKALRDEVRVLTGKLQGAEEEVAKLRFKLTRAENERNDTGTTVTKERKTDLGTLMTGIETLSAELSAMNEMIDLTDSQYSL